MTRRLHGDRGFTLIELLVAMSLMLVVLSATLTTFERFTRTSRKNERFNDQLQTVRQSTDRIVRQLRSLANPTGGTGTIAYADPFKLIFQTTDPSRQWVSYCLDWGQDPPPGGSDPRPANPPSARAPGTRDSEIIWYQTSNSAGAAPSTLNCPVRNGNTSSWAKTTRVTDHVTNERKSTDDLPDTARPLFSYFNGSSRVGITSDSSAFVPLDNQSSSPLSSVITRVVADLFIAQNPTSKIAPNETELTTGAYMRNQNQPPTARMSAFATGTPKTFSLDGGDSTDPEGRTLTFDWYAVQGTDPTGAVNFPNSPGDLPSCVIASGQTSLPTYQKPGGTLTWRCLGQGVIFTKTFFPEEGASPQYVFLRVTDPGSLQDLAKEPATGGCVDYSDPSRPETECAKVTY